MLLLVYYWFIRCGHPYHHASGSTGLVVIGAVAKPEGRAQKELCERAPEGPACFWASLFLEEAAAPAGRLFRPAKLLLCLRIHPARLGKSTSRPKTVVTTSYHPPDFRNFQQFAHASLGRQRALGSAARKGHADFDPKYPAHPAGPPHMALRAFTRAPNLPPKNARILACKHARTQAQTSTRTHGRWR